MTAINRRVLGGLLIALAVLALDQVSKGLILDRFALLPPGQRFIPVMPTINFYLAHNRGVTFGMFSEGGGFYPLILALVAGGIVVALVRWLWQAANLQTALALGMVIGGALGNLYDRIWRDGVVDFIDFYVGDWHWYIFNGADAAICLGVAILVLDNLLKRPDQPK